MNIESPQDLTAYWMPFTSNRAFKQAPRVLSRAEGHYYWTPEGRRLLDGFSGLWTSGLGHCRPDIADAISDQVRRLDYAPAFQIGHPSAFALATQLVELAPEPLTRCFFTNSGSEAVETALKIGLAYQRARGKPGKVHFVGRARAYHGVNLGGLSVGGIQNNRAAFAAALLPNVSHLPATYDRERQAFTNGQPHWGAHLANALEDQVRQCGAETIAAVIVEPVAGSTGVLPPPKGYLERLRKICDEHDILLIFDEVITAFGRVGAAFAAERFGVTPDIITTAKGITNGVIPMGAVLVREDIHESLMDGPPHQIELFHGYTYSGHPVAAAAGLAALEPAFAERIHALKGARHVVDVRNFGLMGAVELSSRPDAPGARGLDAHTKSFERGVVIRNAGDVLQFAPFLNGTDGEIEETFGIVERVLTELE